MLEVFDITFDRYREHHKQGRLECIETSLDIICVLTDLLCTYRVDALYEKLR